MRRFGLGCAAAVVLGIVMAALTIAIILTVPQSKGDLGPYRGRPVALPSGRPASEVQYGSWVFACYEVRGGAPIVVSKRSPGSFIGAWQVTLGSAEEAPVRIELGTISQSRDGLIVSATAVYASGEGHATLYFSPEGKFLELWVDT